MIGLPGKVGKRLIAQIKANEIHATEGGGVTIDEQGADGTFLSAGLCQGDLEGDYTGVDEELIDVNTSLPYDITIVWLELNGTPTVANLSLGYGAFGAGVSFVNFDGEGTDIAQTASVVRHKCSQLVPAGGFVQQETGDWLDSDLAIGTIHYKIHYTYNCADGDPIS